MKEIQVWEYVIKWGLAQNPGLPSDPTNFSKDDFNTLKNTLQQCIPFIRFHNLNSIEFSKKVLPYKKILSKELYKELLNHFLENDIKESLPRISMSKQKSTLDITKVTNSDKESQEVEKNLEEAFKRYKKAAEDGNEVAVYNLAGCYKYGKGVEKDELCRNLEFLRGIITSLLRYMQDIFRPRIFKRSTY
ncbi:hypothetical protein GLOIN_2v1508370 [Rhizophagus irregularis DAOM 181602=DAOM 197198]|uniref:Uncharacterized protein n=2 Tax=Rhizophagus irregularis TaxID=588596 RepID=A0A2P4QV15_RHIID|nr:hypothetical protein GLOIN_2v1508370 [Rhizophagus irregularis DAOM 181602=DAOM 197198]POG81486.1 hypothetical protein GLOIN_2v1508370 [Rhizophagus irregularis DAOM 181602=DAOM 197198]|eukprot:XP_025188352.1 hypothetical protein GLOIN_2v1508370 [Rhizophagus irregularis DAOM 181602=DAOM 197198]